MRLLEDSMAERMLSGEIKEGIVLVVGLLKLGQLTKCHSHLLVW
jgi:hypothetical protein